MYAPKQPKTRPRSSLSTDEHMRRYKKNKCNNTVITLSAICFFLFVLCLFLLGALVFVGRIILGNDNKTAVATSLVNDFKNTPTEESVTKPIRLRTTINNSSNNNNNNNNNNQTPHSPNLTLKKIKHILSPMASRSKVLQQLTYRLPSQNIRAVKYKLALHPNLKTKTFTGNVSVRFDIIKPIAFVPLHSKFLNVSTQDVQKVDDAGNMMQKIVPTLTYEYKDFEYWVTEFEQPLDIGKYVINLSFNGSLADHIIGFYESSYYDKQRKEQRYMAASKFEPTYARQAFPCFDEPAMKATFKITIVRPTGDGYRALSNMDIEDEIINGNLTEVHFTESEQMSTYLACFIVSDFDYQTKMIHGTLPNAPDFELRVFSTPAQVKKVEYALNTAAGITEYYIKYFNISYPLPKLDMAAIPDYVSGATEHWGLITFREASLLYDETISSSENKKRVATVVGHELAHMWFGNLVTMKWWNDLWLNEGFANYMEYKGVNEIHPEWQILHHFAYENLQGVMGMDATLASHPIVQTVENPDQINELFDSITYSKGSSIVRMLEYLVGEEQFRTVVSNYLNNHIFSNADTEDFLAEFESLSLPFDVKSILQTWIEQMGFPVVEVTQTSANVFKLTQKRFLSNPDDYNSGSIIPSQFNYHWSIPITYFTSANTEDVQRAIFNYNDNELTITLPAGGQAVDWIKFNKNQVGYYRVNYPVEMWQNLAQALINNRGLFSVSDRGHLINDAFELADAQQLAYGVALDLINYLEKDRDYVPWSVALTQLSTIGQNLYYTNIYSNFVNFVRKMLIPVYEAVGWDVVGTDVSFNLLRSSILGTACAYGHKDALAEASKHFNAWLANSTGPRPHPDIRNTVYYYGMQQNGNEQIWEQVWQIFVAEQDSQEKLKLMRSLAAVKEPWLLQRYLNLAWNESYVRSQDYFTCLQSISGNRIGQNLVWDYVRENWPKIVERYGLNDRSLGRLMPSITSKFTTQTKLAEMESFFAKYPDGGAGTAARKQALELVKFNIKWLSQNKQQIDDWLSKQPTTQQNRIN